MWNQGMIQQGRLRDSPQPAGDSSSLRVMIDDEPSMLRLVGRILEKANYSVTVAHSGQEGLRVFDNDHFDVVISDRQMPEMNGEELADAVKSRAPEVPIILISGYVGPAVNVKLFRAFLPKPFTQTQLVSVVTDVVPA